MPKSNVGAKKWILANFFSVAAVAVAIANLWLMSKLAPLTLRVSDIGNKVLANEDNIDGLKDDLGYIRGRVDQLYNFFIQK